MVTVAKTAGFCFGVQRAVDMAEKACQEYGCIWALGDIIHNAHEVGRLEKLGVHKAEDVADIPDGVPVLIRAHGVPERVVQQLEQKGCRIVDATCPFVGKIHRIVREESEQGRRIIVIGSRNHPEVVGIQGWCGTSEVYETPEELRDFLLETLRGGGLNTEPLGQTIDQYMDENAIRASHIKYGLVITEMNTLRSVQCTLDDIPQGQLKDYMLASSACFPALRPYEIDGVKYIDGGWRDNMPLELAAKMGATELIGVDVDGVGLTRPNLTGLPTRIIRSHWDLGPLFDFDGARAAKNIALGYMDTMREFGRLGGTAYGILPDENSFMQEFAAEYQAQLSAAISRAPTLALTEALARQHKHYPAAFSENLTAPTRGAIAPLELAAEMVDVPSEVPYTPKLLALTFMGQCDKDPADRYKTLLGREEGNILGEAAMATAVPEDFVTALVSHTLSKMPSAKFL